MSPMTERTWNWNHILQILHYQVPDSWTTLNDFKTKSFSAGVKHLIEIFMGKLVVVVTEKFEFANRDNSTKITQQITEKSLL